MSTKNKLQFSNQFERGHSFNWAGEWAEGKYYFNDEYVTDFVKYGSCILVCRKSHQSSEALRPVIVYSDGIPSDVDSIYWEFIGSTLNPNVMTVLTEEQYQELVDNNQVREDLFYYILEE